MYSNQFYFNPSSFSDKNALRKNEPLNRRMGRNYFDDSKRYSRPNEMVRKRRLDDSNSRIFSR